jgi:membrane AbrB-like protein
MVFVGGAATAYLRFVHGWKWTSALFASSPGAMSQTLALAAEAGADLRSIAMVQSVRLLVLVAVLPMALAAFAATGRPPAPAAPDLLGASWWEPAVLVVLSTLSAMLAYWLRVPGGLITGAMLGSGVLHGSGLVHVNLPPAIAIGAFVILGAIVGARFAGADFRLLIRLLGAGLGALAAGIAVALAFAIVVAEALSLRVGDVILAYAPGGLEAMTILAFALGLDPAFVGAHQLGRFVFVSVALPIAARILKRRESVT